MHGSPRLKYVMVWFLRSMTGSLFWHVWSPNVEEEHLINGGTFLISLPSTICCLAINYQPIRVYLFILSFFIFWLQNHLNKYAKSQREDDWNPYRSQLPSIVNQNVSLHETQNCNQPPWNQANSSIPIWKLALIKRLEKQPSNLKKI